MKDTHVKSIVLSSSAAVYGDAQYSPILECDPLEPINPYGQTKLMMESILEDCRKRYGIQYAALRYFNAAGCDPYGEIGELHTPETHLIPLVIQAILSRNYVLKVFGNKHITADGTCIRDYVHVNDLASAHLLAANYTTGADAKSGIFNLSTGYGTSVMEIINMTEEITGRKVRYEICDARQGEPDTLFAATDLAFRELNWVPQYSVRECIAHAWKFYNH